MRQNTTFRKAGVARVALLALSCALALTACKGGGGAGEAQAKAGEKAPDAVPVEVAQASRRAISASYTGTAPLEPRGESQVVAKTSGVALNVMAEEGQVVRAGQTLVRLDSARSELQVAQTSAQMRKLEANFARSKQLAEQRLLSANDNDQLRYDLENARAANRLANLELSYANVQAPISGVIASRSIKTGNFVQINTPIFRIVDTSRLEATLNVPERELATLKAGLPVQLAVDALPGKVFQGTVDRVAPVVDSGSGTFRVVCAFAGGETLQPGMFGRIRIDYDNRADALVVPRIALLEGEGDPAVFVIRNAKAARVPVKLGYLDGEWAEVRAGIKQGDQVVIAGKTALRDGTVVQLIGKNAPKQVAAAEKSDKPKQ
ncbi:MULTISPECIES: efflux RND transporter periplasmic adaptor subunit [unclassified Lysobacter]|uniref:efflux RND transporter periplasmic adaptor subunit n=1 Tax=unclassified Lysobacter TaxID=2635362 RepID=UPI0006F4A6B8|nr:MULTISPECIES: efflux RND transporter periplasmic adaptor subunit [unclassified Lysobacter]KQZ67785.1 hemolysin D [Lysobacter sp. Root559]KRA80878.1 hemolysin D [Lysobacter sp. Root667]KRC38112.1 hemolysin D [Lysobacter sp. Root76]KRD69437.1 hemolysin D [Lysobacter sp. Root96]